MSGFLCGYNRGNRNIAVCCIRRQIHGKTCSRYDKVSSCCNYFAGIGFIIVHGYHKVKANNSIRWNRSRFLHFFMNGTFIGFYGILIKIWLFKTNLCGGDCSGSTFFCNCSGKPPKTDTNTHSTLYDWNSYLFFSNRKYVFLHKLYSPISTNVTSLTFHFILCESY